MIHYPVDKFFSQFNETLMNSHDPSSQIENEEIPGAQYPIGNDSNDTKTKKMYGILNFMSQILANGEIAASINSLNLKQRDVFNVVHAWAKDYVEHKWHNVEPILTFPSRKGGTAKNIW